METIKFFMKVNEYVMQTIEPSEGMVITQKGDVDIQDRILASHKIFLGVNDSPDNYIEITQEEAREYDRQWNVWRESHNNDEPEDVEPTEETVESMTSVDED